MCALLPDRADLADPALNISGVPAHTLYYKDNYPRLRWADGACELDVVACG
ncbi:hypothetical protein AB0F17_50660 [Nonomuraea sp. NPDC026600]|uniref:hypothetical protein n=1 Tax=Nonomuraea sp. NPDC026600 TaxID=3155363 RepID=UPI0033E1B93A